MNQIHDNMEANANRKLRPFYGEEKGFKERHRVDQEYSIDTECYRCKKQKEKMIKQKLKITNNALDNTLRSAVMDNVLKIKFGDDAEK